MQPQVALEQDYQPGKDVQVKVGLEALPDVPTANIEGLKLERLTVALDECGVKSRSTACKREQELDGREEGLQGRKRRRRRHRLRRERRRKAFRWRHRHGHAGRNRLGSVDPGFRRAARRREGGDKRDVNVTFPDDYPVENLKGKAAVFDVTVKSVKHAGEAKADDAFAQQLGLKDMDQLRGILRDQADRSSTVSRGRT